MKPIAALCLVIASALLATGCGTTGDNSTYTDACARAQALYEAYQKAEAAGVITDPKTIQQAQQAGLYLSIACGWAAPATRGQGAAVLPVDRNGVVIVNP